MAANPQLANVFEQMHKIIEDRENGVRTSDNVIVFDHRLHQFSIGYQCPITIDQVTVTSIDHALQYCKALAFNDQLAMKQIASADSGKSASLVPIRRFNINVWRKYEYKSMQTVIAAKMQQNPTIKQALKMTGTKRLIYASKQDSYFSCGLHLTDDNVLYPQFWTGQNQLGKILEHNRMLS